MKTFKSYLTESHRTYDFRIRIAGDLSDDMITKMKQVLETYKIESISKPKEFYHQIDDADYETGKEDLFHLKKTNKTFHYTGNSSAKELLRQPSLNQDKR